MKKASKILTLILIAVFVLSVFAGCDLFGRDVVKYRSTTAMTVGDQEITIGKLLDTFNSYYNNYYYYISAGYLTSDSLLEMVMNSLLQQYIQVDDYVQKHKSDANVRNSPLKDLDIKNAAFLSQEQFEYCIKYVKHTAFTTFDSTVITNLSVKHDIGEAKEEDTSRDFTKYDDLKEAVKYADFVRDKNFDSEEADEYFEKNYSSVDFTSVENILSDYVYKTEDETVKTVLKELNDRLEDDSDEITFDEYVEAQQNALDQYGDTVKNNYGITLQAFLKSQLEDMVTSCIIALWNYDQYKDIDIAENANKTNSVFSEAQKAEFDISDNFDSFITKLSNSSFIYDVPEDMQGKYVFVKNILIPFTSQQSALLRDQDYASDSEAYIALRNKLAAEIAADYFDSDKYEHKDFDELFTLEPNDDEDSDRKFKKLTGLFSAESVTGDDGKVTSKLVINPDGALGQFFNTDGTVNKKGDLSVSETIVELMRRFNTDTAQHTSRYDYVVYVGDDWEDYNHSWVKEFYTAVNELGHDEDGKFLASNIGKYAMCVSTYGVHIIYVEDFVENYVYNTANINWSTAWLDTSSMNYVRYKDEFEAQVSLVTKDALQEIELSYVDGGKININKQFKRFLKDNGFKFDFDEYLVEFKEEL